MTGRPVFLTPAEHLPLVVYRRHRALAGGPWGLARLVAFHRWGARYACGPLVASRLSRPVPVGGP